MRIINEPWVFVFSEPLSSLGKSPEIFRAI
jgi:hypothetical protein